MKYEWDELKKRKNLAKHGLSFEDAEQVFSGPCVTFEDDRFPYGEGRFVTLIGRPLTQSAAASCLTSHRQNDAELRLPAQHALVSLGRLFQRIGFNHRTHAAYFGEMQRVLGIGWCSRGPALNPAASTDEL
jgi:uncharacterized DUF497 family protein